MKLRLLCLFAAVVASFVADIITMPLLTPLLAAAKARGCGTQNGQDMFNAQGDFITQFLLGA